MSKNISHDQRGFTLQEMLITVAIMICLLAVTIVGIVTYAQHLQITELDNAARQIYMAAQNRAILLKNDQALEGYIVQQSPASGESPSNEIPNVDKTPNSDVTTQITAYYVAHDDEHIQQLLPVGSIDPALWEGDFYIIYEPTSASVVDVFYSKQELPVEDDFEAFYRKWRGYDKSVRMKNDPMIGYYGGEAADSGTAMALRTPVINIYNEETLEVEVTYWVPSSLDNKVDFSLTFEYQGKSCALPVDDFDKILEFDYYRYTKTYLLDSVEASKQFKDFLASQFPGESFILGNEFTITAEIQPIEGIGEVTVNGAKKTATDNSLFAATSTEERADVAYMRHLQNLDAAFSGVQGKTAAMQTKDITCVADYDFDPIENDELQSYNGQNYRISDLNTQKVQNAGLFGTFSGTEITAKELVDVCLVNAQVQATQNAGVLVGNGQYLALTGCEVYWENRSATATNLRDVLGDSTNGLNYKVLSGQVAGGLAGTLSNSTIKTSFASTLLSGKTVGGLVGDAQNVTASASYADAYLQGEQIGGLFGANASATANTVSDSYAVGYADLQNNGVAAGIGLGNNTVTRCYSAVLYSGEGTKYALTQSGSCTDAYYLEAQEVQADTNGAVSVSYDDLTDPTKWDALFGSEHIFSEKSSADSHPYNLQTSLLLDRYNYPALQGIDHWGDWGARFQNGSLVYYEVYDEGNGNTSYGFSGGGIDLLKNDKPILKDGYGVASDSVNATIGAALTVEYDTQSGTNTLTKEYKNNPTEDQLPVYTVSSTDGKTYYLLPLADEIINSSHASTAFYQKIGFRLQEDEQATEYYYNPHFANTIREYTADADLPTMANGLSVEIRTPRHLYMLSKFTEYYASLRGYHFVQKRDLDYGIYTGYELFQGGLGMQDPIGISEAQPFRNNYHGGSYVIRNLKVNAADTSGTYYQYIGLFGYNIGTVQDTVYEMGQNAQNVVNNQNSARPIYIGGLLGYNGGTVQNSAVYDMQFKGGSYSYSTIYVGGFVGSNKGIIRNSAAEVTSVVLDSNLSNAYAAGFVGKNEYGANIDRCYAVGKLSASRSRSGDVYACGFAGENLQNISNCYAATWLTISGDAKAFGFGTGASTNCYYLNSGNFSYNGAVYTAQYTDPSATPESWDAFTAKTGGVAEKIGMQAGAAVYQQTNANYPYPSSVIDAAQKPIHYGEWPKNMELGVMGVYYWEKMETPVEGSTANKESYHISVITVDLDASKVSKESTLSTQHADGGVITEYGYGYFHSAQSNVTITTDGKTVYNNSTDVKSWNENQTANKALQQLMGTEYTFHSYNTLGTSSQDGGNGLYLGGNAIVYNDKAAPASVWTLQQNASGKTYTETFSINPFFADSMAYQTSASKDVAANVPTVVAGLTEENPYQVRSIQQLQYINWHTQNRNTTTVTDSQAPEVTYFMFLGIYRRAENPAKTYIRPYYWLQTHDIDASGVKNYTPIAALLDTGSGETGGSAPAWFGGSYNGNDYTIQELNISTTDVSTTGLFGITVDAELKNIVLYSPSGNATISATNTKHTDIESNNWYAIGGLVGLAANTQNSTRTIENCSVAGYKIIDKNTQAGYGGGGVGGLVGICNMALQKCSAVTEITIAYTHRQSDRNIRVGGIAGSCQQSISNCYAGGEIILGLTDLTIYGNENNNANATDVHIGGIVGGCYMKALSIGERSIVAEEPNEEDGYYYQNYTIKNCYSFVVLPNIEKLQKTSISRETTGSKQEVKGSNLFAIGGRGEIAYEDWQKADRLLMNYKDCYYLKSCLKNITLADPKDSTTDFGNEYDGVMVWDVQYVVGKPGESVFDVTIEELSTGGEIFERFLGFKDGENPIFGAVTTQSESGIDLNGKFSYGTSPYLLGQNYPFPTILTQESDLVKSGFANVHYGDWVSVGIKRDNGTKPIEVDLFANAQNGEAVYTEKLDLTGLATGSGTWSASVNDGNIAQVKIDKNGLLTVTAQQAGSTTITVTYTQGQDSFSTEIELNITANLRLVAETMPLSLFVSEDTTAKLVLQDMNGKKIENTVLENLTIGNFTVEYDTGYLETASVAPVEPLPELEEGEELPAETPLQLSTTTKGEQGNTQLTLGYTFTYNGKTYTTTSAISAQILKPEVEVEPLKIVVDKWESTGEYIQTYTSDQLSQQIKLMLDDEPAAISDMQILDFEVTDTNALWAEWTEDKTEMLFEVYEEVYESAGYPTSITFDIEFAYGGSVHKMQVIMQITVEAPATDEGDGTDSENSSSSSSENSSSSSSENSSSSSSESSSSSSSENSSSSSSENSSSSSSENSSSSSSENSSSSSSENSSSSSSESSSSSSSANQASSATESSSSSESSQSGAKSTPQPASFSIRIPTKQQFGDIPNKTMLAAIQLQKAVNNVGEAHESTGG